MNTTIEGDTLTLSGVFEADRDDLAHWVCSACSTDDAQFALCGKDITHERLLTPAEEEDYLTCIVCDWIEACARCGSTDD